MTQNPCEPNSVPNANLQGASPKPKRWAAIGFAVGCVPIAALGTYGLYADALYAATLPPDMPRCGNPAMAAMFTIFPISPVLGGVGALVGYVSAIVCDAATCNPTQRQEGG
jgi:hypothetical protein